MTSNASVLPVLLLLPLLLTHVVLLMLVRLLPVCNMDLLHLFILVLSRPCSDNEECNPEREPDDATKDAVCNADTAWADGH